MKQPYNERRCHLVTLIAKEEPMSGFKGPKVILTLLLWANTSGDFIILKILFIYFREGKRERKRGRETSMCGCLLRSPYRGPVPQLMHVPWLGIELRILWFSGQHSIHWVTLARATGDFKLKPVLITILKNPGALKNYAKCKAWRIAHLFILWFTKYKEFQLSSLII